MNISNLKTRGKAICPLLLILSYAFGIHGQQQVENPNAIASKFEMYVDSAECYSSTHRWDDAERMTVKALKLRPANKSNWLLWSNLAEIRRNKEDLDGALEAYNIGLSMQPSSTTMLAGRAELFLALGEKDDALLDLDALIQLSPDTEIPHIMRGWIRLEKGMLDEAEEDFIYVTTKNADNPEAYNGLAAVKSYRGMPTEAVELYTKSLALRPDEKVYFYKTTLLIDLGKLPEATDTLREGMKEFPRNGNLYLLRGYLHKLNFQNEEAEIAVKLAREYGCDKEFLEKLFPKK